MQIENSFEVPTDPHTTWETLLDIPAIAPCMPGARILEVRDDDTYKGEVQVRLGPMMLSFQGTGQIVEKDTADHSAKVRAQGRDTKGRGNASADIAFKLVQVGEGTRVDITTDLNLSGSVAQYGRSSGMINDLANHLVGEFAKNLSQKLNDGSPAAQETAVKATDANNAQESSGQSAKRNEKVDTSSEQVAPKEEGKTASGSSETRPLSGFALFVMLVKGWFRRTFGGGK